MSENNLMADKLLKAIQEEERDKTRGRLKIFFWICCRSWKNLCYAESGS